MLSTTLLVFTSLAIAAGVGHANPMGCKHDEATYRQAYPPHLNVPLVAGSYPSADGLRVAIDTASETAADHGEHGKVSLFGDGTNSQCAAPEPENAPCGQIGCLNDGRCIDRGCQFCDKSRGICVH